jgi:hypothetical protein
VLQPARNKLAANEEARREIAVLSCRVAECGRHALIAPLQARAKQPRLVTKPSAARDRNDCRLVFGVYRDRRSIEARESEGESGPPAPARAGEAAQYQKLSDETVGLGSETKTLQTSLDAHTKENHKKRKTLQTRRDDLAKAMETIAANTNEGQKAMLQLYASVESSLALAKHAQEWTWKEEPSKV